MRLLWAICGAAIIAAAAHAEPIYVIDTPVADDAAINEYGDLGYVVDHVTPYGATLYLNGTQLWEFDVSGTPYTLIEIQDGNYAKGGANTGTTLGTYMSYETYTAMLQNLANAYPSICQLFSVGQSVQGRELWCMRITDNIGVEEFEPEFKYVGNMHGDETVSGVVLLYLIDLLLTQYGVDDRITNLVNATDISIVPHMNPDGYELVQRGNANSIDLNRHFPQWSIDFNDSYYDGGPLGASVGMHDISRLTDTDRDDASAPGRHASSPSAVLGRSSAPPKRRSRAAYSATQRANSASSKSGHRTSVKTSSA